MLLYLAVKLQLAVASTFVQTGAEDYTRGPDWESIAFVSGVVRWFVGIATAGLVVYAGVLALVRIGKLAKADNQHTAKDAGIGIAFAAFAAVFALMFSDLWVGLIRTVAT